MASLTAGLLGFNFAAPPAKPAKLSLNGLNGQLAPDAFDQNAATQLMREAAFSERLVALASDNLAKAVQEFTALSAAVAADPALPSDPQKLLKEVQKRRRAFNKALVPYTMRIAASNQVGVPG